MQLQKKKGQLIRMYDDDDYDIKMLNLFSYSYFFFQKKTRKRTNRLILYIHIHNLIIFMDLYEVDMFPIVHIYLILSNDFFCQHLCIAQIGSEVLSSTIL